MSIDVGTYIYIMAPVKQNILYYMIFYAPIFSSFQVAIRLHIGHAFFHRQHGGFAGRQSYRMVYSFLLSLRNRYGSY